MSRVNPLVYNKLLSIFYRGDLYSVDDVEKVVKSAFDKFDDLYKVYEYIGEKLDIKLSLTDNDILDIISLSFVSLREKELRVKLFKTKPYWWLLTDDKDRLVKFLISKLMTMLDSTSSLSQTVPAPSLDDLVKVIKQGSIPPVSEMSNKELLDLLDLISRTKSGKPSPGALSKNLNTNNLTALQEILKELASRVLSNSERRRFTEFIKTLLDFLNNADFQGMSDVKSKMEMLIVKNFHNMEVDNDLIDKMTAFNESMGYGLFHSNIDKIVEADPNILIKMLTIIDHRKYDDLFNSIVDKLLDLALTKTTFIETGHKKFIDYRRTIYATLKNAEVPKVVYMERQDTIGDISIIIDASGSMRSGVSRYYKKKELMDAIQVSVVTSYLFIRAVKTFGNQNYKLLMFADKIVDLTDFSLEQVISLVKNDEALSNILGGGTNLYPALKYVEEKVANPDMNIIMITDTGDTAVAEKGAVLKRIKEKSKTFAVVCPSDFFEETAPAFTKAGIPILKYDSFEELIDNIKKILTG